LVTDNLLFIYAAAKQEATERSYMFENESAMAMDSVKKKFLQCTPTSAFSSQRGGENGLPSSFLPCMVITDGKRRQSMRYHAKTSHDFS